MDDICGANIKEGKMTRYSREYIHDEVDNHRQVAQWWIEADKVDARFQEFGEENDRMDSLIEINGIMIENLHMEKIKYRKAFEEIYHKTLKSAFPKEIIMQEIREIIHGLGTSLATEALKEGE